MKLIGSHVLQAPVQKVWDLIRNHEFLAKITPGIYQLEHEFSRLYKSIIEIKIGPVHGKFEGSAELMDVVKYESFRLKLIQNSKIGNVEIDVKIMLKPTENNQTELSFVGVANMSGLLARTGSRVMSGVANTLTKQFFTNFEKDLQNY